jgi:WD40 repeat protein/tRNA A-37 threonylcarbamoyl transferase component Bud32
MTNPLDARPSGPDAAPTTDDPALQLFRQWQDGQEPDARQFLQRAGPLQVAQVVAVLRVDQRERWRRGKPLPAETYLEWCPALADDQERALELVYGEYVLREELGQAPAAADYLRRFPQYADRFRQQLELHRALAGSALTAARPSKRSQVETPGDLAPEAVPGSPPPSVAGYEVLAELGRGGMGVVYKARHLKLKRLVALKMILAGGHAGARELDRFRREAEAVARLQHPNIVQIYDVGEQEGRPFISLELLDGGSLADKLIGTPRPPGAAAQLVETLARAVHAAHQQNLIHRDLKPANVLFAADGTPKITDFGLARLTDGASGQTQDGAILGTPSYMAPEQARGRGAALTPAADTYALGAILYECLTGRPPFQAATPLETIFLVVTQEPVPPGRLQLKLPRDLETICLKCLRKEPDRRYQSALDLADDLRRFRANEPTLAQPAGLVELTAKWARRHHAVAVLTALLLVTFVTGFGLVTWKWQEAARASEEATKRADVEARAAADALQHAADVRQAGAATRQALERSRQFGFTAQLWRAVGLIDKDPVLAVRALEDEELCPPERRDFPWRYYRQQSGRLLRRLAQQEKGIHNGAAVSPDGTLLAALTAEGQIRLWDVATGKPGPTLPGHGGGYQAMTFSPDGKILATGGADGLVNLWDVPDGKFKATLRWQLPDGGTRWVMSLKFHPDGGTLAAGGGSHEPKASDPDARWRKPVVWVWDVAGGTGKLLTATPRLKGNRMEDSGVNCLAYAPDGKTLAVGTTRESSVLVLDAETGDELQRFRPEAGWIVSIAFTPDGKTLAIGNSTSNVFLCDLVARKVRRTLYGHLNYVGAMLFTADGDLVTGARDGTVRIWEAGTGQFCTTFRCEAGVQELSLLPGGKQLLVITSREAQVWSLKVQAAQGKLFVKGKSGVAGLAAVDFDPAGTCLAVVGQDEVIRIWDVATQTIVQNLTGHTGRCTAVAYGPAGTDLLVSGGEDCKVLLWSLRQEKPRQPVVLAGHDDAVTCVAVTPDGKWVLSGSLDGTVRLWDSGGGKPVHKFDTGRGQVHTLALSGDGQRLVTGGQGGVLCVWDLKERRLLQTTPARGKDPVNRVAVTPDGRLAVSIQGRAVAFHDLDGKGEARPQKQIPAAWSVAFTPDGKTLVVGGNDRAVRLYDVASGHFRGELLGHSHQVVAAAFNRDATLLATASRGSLPWDRQGEVLLWAGPREQIPGTAKPAGAVAPPKG